VDRLIIPKPPSFLGLVAIDQAVRGGFLPFKSDPLQKQYFLYLSMSLMIVGGGELKGAHEESRECRAD
jgi:hypothetical protein